MTEQNAESEIFKIACVITKSDQKNLSVRSDLIWSIPDPYACERGFNHHLVTSNKLGDGHIGEISCCFVSCSYIDSLPA